MRIEMKQRYRKFKRTWGTFYAYDNLTGNSISLKTRLRTEADRQVHAMNESESQPAMNLSLARVYLNGADPKRHHAGARCFAGNFLFSTGPNSQGGGKRTTKGHYDVPMRDCTVTLDNDVIIERGRIADDKMRVMRVAR